ncbi:RF-1 domain-containing protein [Xylogone sp. PMI_703]|nr:RF-1 domain-containing protein [Xylogone sp. PMI_703]
MHTCLQLGRCTMLGKAISKTWHLSLEVGLCRSVRRRGICASAIAFAKKMPDRPPPLAEDEFTETFLKGTGPGGQKINKTSSAVQLKHIATGIVLKVQATRSRTQNRKIARQMLAEKLEEKEKGNESRTAVIAETKRKKKSSATKKSRRKYRLLEEAKESADTTSQEDPNSTK